MSKSTDKRNKRQPSAHARNVVADCFDAQVLGETCETWDFRDHADLVTLKPAGDGRERFYWHRDNGADILAVAHLDTVQDDRRCSVVDTASGLLACSGALDDRLGVYVILDMLPKLGIVCDVLLTTDEEIGQSTASAFDTDKQYNWIIQFDRGGTDVVMYDYETPQLCEMVESSGARVGEGSYSDICMLEHLGCVGLNWGVGYNDYHSTRSHAWLDDTFRMIARFVKFYNANHETFIPHEPMVYDDAWAKTYRYDDGDTFSWSDDVDYTVTADCGHVVDLADEASYVEVVATSIVCRNCAVDDGLANDE